MHFKTTLLTTVTSLYFPMWASFKSCLALLLRVIAVVWARWILKVVASLSVEIRLHWLQCRAKRLCNSVLFSSVLSYFSLQFLGNYNVACESVPLLRKAFYYTVMQRRLKIGSFSKDLRTGMFWNSLKKSQVKYLRNAIRERKKKITREIPEVYSELEWL